MTKSNFQKIVAYLFRTSTSFAYTFQNQLTMDLPRKEKRDKSETYKYVIKRTSGLWKWLL